MIIPDTNLLIYAHDQTAPEHAAAKAWWNRALNGPEPIGIPWVVLLAFTRLMSHPSICRNPLSIDEIRRITRQWRKCPHLRFLNPSEQAPDRFFDLLDQAGMGGNLCTDALIAVHALEHSATVYTNDRDFARFGGLRTENPL